MPQNSKFVNPSQLGTGSADLFGGMNAGPSHDAKHNVGGVTMDDVRKLAPIDAFNKGKTLEELKASGKSLFDEYFRATIGSREMDRSRSPAEAAFFAVAQSVAAKSQATVETKSSTELRSSDNLASSDNLGFSAEEPQASNDPQFATGSQVIVEPESSTELRSSDNLASSAERPQFATGPQVPNEPQFPTVPAIPTSLNTNFVADGILDNLPLNIGTQPQASQMQQGTGPMPPVNFSSFDNFNYNMAPQIPSQLPTPANQNNVNFSMNQIYQEQLSGPAVPQFIAPHASNNFGYASQNMNIQPPMASRDTPAADNSHVGWATASVPTAPMALQIPPQSSSNNGLTPQMTVGNDFFPLAMQGNMANNMNGLYGMGNFSLPPQSYATQPWQFNGMSTAMPYQPFVAQPAQNYPFHSMCGQTEFFQGPNNVAPMAAQMSGFGNMNFLPNNAQQSPDGNNFGNGNVNNTGAGVAAQDTPRVRPTMPGTFHREILKVKFEHLVLPPSCAQGTVQTGWMYVEKLEPIKKKQELCIILVHGDFHTGKVWMSKPDGNEGWATFFVDKGFTVYVIDLPACGRSNELDGQALDWKKLATETASMSKNFIEKELTAIGNSGPVRWLAAARHSQWPGTGKQGDRVFDTYADSVVPLHFRRHQRQSLGKGALTALLENTGPAILLGEGSGATISWLAADAMPETVKAVMAIEPAGPPGGSNRKAIDSVWNYVDSVTADPQKRPYGLTDIPLTFDPPVPEPEYNENGVKYQPLNLVTTRMNRPAASYMLQRGDSTIAQFDATGRLFAKNTPAFAPRKLINLKKMPQLVVTGDASQHALCDGATVAFMKQAEVAVDWLELGELSIFGNGHLMFLEENSDDVAQQLFYWLTIAVPGVQATVSCTRGYPVAEFVQNG